MSTVAKVQKKSGVRVLDASKKLAGQPMASLSRGIALVRVKKQRKPTIGNEEQARTLFKKAVNALDKPGISRTVVFKQTNNSRKVNEQKTVYSFFIDPKDTRYVIREDAKGARTKGRLIKGEFQPEQN